MIEEGEDSTEEDADHLKGINADLDLEEHNVHLDLEEQADTRGAAAESLL